MTAGSLPHEAPWIARAYDGSTASYLALDALGWGELRNLGYYSLLRLPLLLGGLSGFQRRLALESLRLLDVRPGERVLDAGCGHGWTTVEIARQGASALGIDLLPSSIEEAKRRYDTASHARFAAADATALPAKAEGFALDPGSVDRVHCLEAGFHFGPEGRAAFLAEAWRILRPGGRLVLVDFVWLGDRPEDIADADRGGRVRDTWRFEQFEPLQRYRARALRLGFEQRAALDWSTAVTGRFVKISWLLARLGNTGPGRALLTRLFPGLKRLRAEQWPDLLDLVEAHDRVRRHSGYTAFVFDKPAGPKLPAGEGNA